MGKVRGRRGEKKSKKEEESLGENNDFVPLEDSNENSNSSSGDSKNTIPTTFFGLVDSTELEYFKQAESNLNINAFETPEEKKNFIGSIFEEARGKELKLATNQLCSKLIERIILESNKKQMIQLFNAFNGHFVALSNQKYSSHCLETFFIRAASNVEKELLRENGEGEAEEEEEEEDAEGSSDAYISFENMFLFILTELKPNMKQMIPNQYASHVLRVLLLILAGKELPSSIESNSILRSKKSKIARKMIEIKDSEDYQRNFQTPSSFKDELTDTLQIIYKDQTSKSLREMAIEKVASPVIQLLVQLEGLVDKKRSFWCLIFNDYEVESDKKEEAFVEYLLSDPVGSHFLEVAIDSQRHKNVERLYNYYMKDRVLKLAKRETTGAFVIMTLLKKMKPNHQIELLDQLVPHLNELIVNNLEIGKSVVDCSIERNNYKKDEIISKFIQFFNKDLSSSSNSEEEGKEEKEKDSSNNKVESQLLENVLRLSTSTLGNTRDDWPTAEERRRALFLEKLISYDDKILMAVIEGLLDLPVERLIQMCCHGVFSHVVENVLIPERVDFITRKKILNTLMDHIIELTCNAQGSHIVDQLWPFTIKLNVYKDRIAEELINNKEMVKKSVYGKLVWKNWSLDMYIRRRGDWKRLIKEQELEKFPPKENDSESSNIGDKRPQYQNNTNGKRPFRNDRNNRGDRNKIGDRSNRGDYKRSRY